MSLPPEYLSLAGCIPVHYWSCQCWNRGHHHPVTNRPIAGQFLSVVLSEFRFYQWCWKERYLEKLWWQIPGARRCDPPSGCRPWAESRCRFLRENCRRPFRLTIKTKRLPLIFREKNWQQMTQNRAAWLTVKRRKLLTKKASTWAIATSIRTIWKRLFRSVLVCLTRTSRIAI